MMHYNWLIKDCFLDNTIPDGPRYIRNDQMELRVEGDKIIVLPDFKTVASVLFQVHQTRELVGMELNFDGSLIFADEGLRLRLGKLTIILSGKYPCPTFLWSGSDYCWEFEQLKGPFKRYDNLKAFW